MIPFTQYILPNGRRREIEILRPADVEVLAKCFLDSGGTYECEILRTGAVSLTAVKTVDGEPQDIVILIAFNDEQIPVKVDELVRKSQEYIS